MTHHRLLRSFLFALTILALAAPAAATTVLRMDLAQLVEASDVIVVATVAKSESFIDEGRIFTRTSLEVEETWKGKATKKVEIVHIGGRKGKLATVVHGMPSFTVGERAVVFLEQPAGYEHHVVTGLSQGKIDLRKGEDGAMLLVPKIDEHSLVSPTKMPDGTVKLERAPTITAPAQQIPKTLGELRTRVHSLQQTPASEAETE